MGPSLAHIYRYAGESDVSPGSSPTLRLVTSGGTAEHPAFFRGFLTRPKVTADLLRGVSRIVGSRFFVPPSMLAKVLSLADPVVTSGGGMLRFEGFSACASAHVRVDLAPGAYDGDIVGKGTTNVDFNPKMRGALASVDEKDRVGLRVGKESITLERDAGDVVEKKVLLPVRWLKSFVEVEAYHARMKRRFSLDAAEALRFLRGLPRTKTARHLLYIVPHGRGVRVSMTKSPGAVVTSGVERLRVLEELAPFAKALAVYADDEGQSTAWELDFGSQRYTLSLSADVTRGFSGEGQALRDLSRHGAGGEDIVASLRAALAWQSELRAGELASRFSVADRDAAVALAVLGSRGLVGFDVGRGAYFHREMPFDLAQLDALAPRLKAAKKLVAEAGCTIVSRTDEGAEVHVRGTDVVHRVRLEGRTGRCTCPWFAKHGGVRGPCKHVLAAEIMLEAS